MSLQLRSVQLTPDDILKELIMDVLPSVLDGPHEVIASSLPFEGSHILALDAGRGPTVVSYDGRDGGRALLAGLGAIEGLADNRALLYRLYPGLFGGSLGGGAVFRIEAVHLITLAPTPPPGGVYLERALPLLSAYTFRILEIRGDVGLLLEACPCRRETTAVTGGLSAIAPASPFRTGGTALSAEEERYFREA